MSKYKILIVNPNSNKGMTDSLTPVLDALRFNDISYDLFTARDGPNSINNEEDAAESERHCLPSLLKIADNYAGFLVACYSAHPLVATLRDKYPDKHVLGIFEASITAALATCGQASPAKDGRRLTWGIVTTGKAWGPLLTDATWNFFGFDDTAGGGGATSNLFAGVQTTGFNADELHDAPKEVLRERLTLATKRLLDEGAAGGKARLKVVVLGCAGMSELEGIVKEVIPRDVKIVDGVKAGYCQLASMIMQGI